MGFGYLLLQLSLVEQLALDLFELFGTGLVAFGQQNVQALLQIGDFRLVGGNLGLLMLYLNLLVCNL